MSISILVIIVTKLLIITMVGLVIISAQRTYVRLGHFSSVISKQCSSRHQSEVCPTLVPLSQFLPFGLEAGDELLPPGDDESFRVNLSITFPFMNHRERVLFLNINGLISFNQPIDQSYKPKCKQLPVSQRMVAPFWADVLTFGRGGQIFFRQSTDPALLKKVHSINFYSL